MVQPKAENLAVWMDDTTVVQMVAQMALEKAGEMVG